MKIGGPWRYGKIGILLLSTVPFLYPFVFLVATGLKPNREFVQSSVSFPKHVTGSNLLQAWTQAQLGPAMVHSLIAVGSGVIIVLIISSAGAFWFYRHKGKLVTVLRVSLIGTMALPPPVFIIPLYVMLSGLGLTNNLLVLGVVYAAWNGSFGLYLMFAYFQQAIPVEVMEAAHVDGATVAQQFWRIVMPLSKPALATLTALAFVWSWGDLLISSILVQNPGARTLIVSTALLNTRYNINVPVNASAALIALIPMLCVFLILQRYLVRGIALGAGK